MKILRDCRIRPAKDLDVPAVLSLAVDNRHQPVVATGKSAKLISAIFIGFGRTDDRVPCLGVLQNNPE